MFEVPEHAVSASNIYFIFTAIAEIVDPTVFQESADDAADGYGWGQPGRSGPERANPSNYHVDGQLGLRGFIQGPNQFSVGQVIELEYEPGFTACLFVVYLALDHFDQAVSQVDRGYEKLPISRLK
jgi:hypothetical protein